MTNAEILDKKIFSILIVEDNSDHRELMCRSLEDLKFISRIESVSSGEECLKSLSSGKYDLAVVDYRMPNMNGLELLTKIKRNGWDIPIVIVTGRGDEKIAVEVMKEGAYDYITKTKDFINNLPHAIENTLERYVLKKELQRQEERMRIVVQNLPAMVGALDNKNKLIMWNRECEILSGYSTNEMLGNSKAFELLFPDKKYRKKVLDIYKDIEGEFRDLEMTMTCKDGTEKIISWAKMSRHYPIPGWDTWAVGIDITKHRKAEEAILRSEERYRLLADNVTDVIWISDLEMKMLYITPSVEKISGYTVEEVMAQSPGETLTPESLKKTYDLLENEMADIKSGTFQPRIFELEFVHKDGSIVFTESTVSIIYSKDKKDIQFLGVTREISKRKAAEQALRESETLYTALFQHNPIQTVVVDREGKVIEFNKAKQGSGDRLPGIGDVMYKDYAANHKIDMHKELKKCLNSGKMAEFAELEYYDRFLSIKISPFEGGAIITSQDITDLKKLQEQLIHSEKLSAVGQLAAGVAHEFNNLLTVILGRSQLALEEDSIDEIKQSLLEIEKKTKHGSNLVKNLGTFARPKEPKFQTQDITEVIDEVLRLQKKQLQLDNIIVEREYIKHSKVSFDWGQLEQVFINLLINATHAIKPKSRGTISIAVRDTEGFVKIQFTDTGIGMSKEISKRIFEPFFSTKGAWSSDGLGIPGTGLGLSVTHSIIKQHDGTIEVESKKGKGTTFTITLPVAKSLFVEEQSPRVKLIDKDIEKIKDVKILVIDDEKDMMELMALVFQKAGFKNVMVEDKAEHAVSILKVFNPDIVFLDILMPDMNGEQFFNEIQSVNKDVPVVFMTGKLNIDESKYLERGASAFIKKPFDVYDIIDLLKKNIVKRD